MARKGGTPENLRPCKPGETHNPNGRPKILPELKEALRDILMQQVDGKTKLEILLETLYKQANKGDVRAIQEVLDRFYGKIKQEHDINMDTEINITFTPK
jgi:hypothetical protein